ncbi:MAG: SUMF1/EgtB/PvdO family nonheme iron enzyme [Pseudanabaenaceae cyanobacterium SKYGB_i_bin29]|nr:SUMF1/EgtB/PvdO family nonheme iron enzyme [Pseudanabaenaceae cyanobacterium SKYG29]MDW8422378.1 SUMF1/EgtB/PvdO family nonheme iron enzyme [Pseudanabaenaceae cyanobacterium SKYGB_i_bin29]
MNISTEFLLAEMAACRQHTLAIFTQVEESICYVQAHPEFSPIGWHLGHIAYTESLWLLPGEWQSKLSIPEAKSYFSVENLPKSNRSCLPPLADIIEYCQEVRELVKNLSQRFGAEQYKLLAFLLQHESQHREIICYVLHMLGHPVVGIPPVIPAAVVGRTVTISGGEFTQGSDDFWALDNERQPFCQYVDEFTIDVHPITRGQYREFIEAGGYDREELWSREGWQWRQQQPEVFRPRFWQGEGLTDHHPVYGVSFYEAEAYAKFVGKRLPTESEWELSYQFLPDYNYVYQWTQTKFYAYPGFRFFPYQGYSANYFDDQHFVLRGKSWQSQKWTVRPTFRNWYHPHIRNIFVGIRCVMPASG